MDGIKERAAALRRRLSGAPERELAAARAELKRARKRLRKTRRELELSKARLAEHRVLRPQLPVEVKDVISAVRGEHLSYLSASNLGVLAGIVRELENAGTEGLIIEAGTARGGSAIVMASAKSPERPMKVYDVFGLIPEPGEGDGEDVHKRYETIVSGEAKGPGGQTYYGYRTDLYKEVEESFARHGVPVGERKVELVQGLFEDTIDLSEPVAFAHLDGDWYQSTMVCLTRIAPLLVPGGRIVLDDYYDWSGCRRAVDEYFADRPGYRVEKRAKVHVIKE